VTSHQGATSLAYSRRAQSRLFTERVFVGHAIDIGSGPDALKTDPAFPLLKTIREWDQTQGDATYMDGVPGESFDLVYSSHCLEHIERDLGALCAWWNLVKVGGHLCLAVPDEGLYERFRWPPRYNSDHKHSYSTGIGCHLLHMTESVGMDTLTRKCHGGRLISLVRLEDGFDDNSFRDQTADGTCECGIELVIRKERA